MYPETLRRFEIRDLPDYQGGKNFGFLWGAQIRSDSTVRRGFVRVVGTNGDIAENVLAPINIEGAEHKF